MKRVCKTIVLSGAVGLVFATAAAAGPVKDRQKLMKSVGDSMKIVVPMLKGEAPYDAAAAAAAMDTINGVPDKFVTLFPEDSKGDPDSEAKDSIWENMKDFTAKANNLKTASAAAKEAAGKGLDPFKAAVFGALVKTCKECHDTYRLKKN